MNNSNKNDIFDKEYFNDLNKIKETIKINQNKAMVIVNSAMIMTYYEIGSIINERKSWGSKHIERLSNDLKEYGKGFSFSNLKRMAQFSSIIGKKEIRAQAVLQIPWGSIILIMQKSNSHDEMLWYINETHKRGWSRSMVLNQFELKAYERSLISPNTTSIMKSSDLTKGLFKDTYVFDFLDRNKIKNEKDLKNQLVDNVIKFLQELGPGFALVGREHKINIPNDEDIYIDLLMYHLLTHSYIVIEVKLRKYHYSDIGQLMFYVNAVNDFLKMDIDNETIGLILCKDASDYTVKTTLKNINMKLGISKYKAFNELTVYLEKRLKEIEKK